MTDQNKPAGTTIPFGTVATGLQATDDYYAHECQQGGRVHYMLCVPIRQLPVMLPIPDPAKTLEDNREVKLPRAQQFATYVRKNEGWHAGPLTVRTNSSTVKFEAFENQGDAITRIGLLKIPRIDRDGFRIVDGQHRQLGFNLLLNDLANNLVNTKQKLQGAISRGEDQALIKNFKQQVEELEQLQKRLDRESVQIDLLVEDDHLRARQVFVDVADNALGVRKTVVARFDQRKVVNRAMNELLATQNLHPLLANRVDDQHDVIRGKNQNLLAASKLADLIRITEKGIGGRRFGKSEEKHAEESSGAVEAELVRQTTNFLDLLVSSFPDLKAVADGDLTPPELRDKSLLGSITILRALAGVFYELKLKKTSDQEIASFFTKLDKYMAIPITAGTPSGDLWLGVIAEKEGIKNQVFMDGAVAPSARAQDLITLVAAITSWTESPPAEFSPEQEHHLPERV